MKVLKRFVQASTVLGIVALFAMFVDPANNGMVLMVQIGMMGFTCIAVWFGIAWLFNYANSPDPKYQQKLDKVILYPMEFIATQQAYKELGIVEHAEGLLIMGRDKEKEFYVMVQHRTTGKYSKRYYYTKDASFIMDTKTGL